MVMPPQRVAVIFGGRSGEHEVSLVSARSVIAALDRGRWEPLPVGVTRKGEWLTPEETQAALDAGRTSFGRGGASLTSGSALQTLGACDVAFPLIHGTFGEDGTLQGLLELAGVPYAGAGVAASAIGMDKALQKALFREAGIPIARYGVVRSWEVEGRCGEVTAYVTEAAGYPCFVKPANGGSSVGVSRVRSSEDLPAALAAAFAYDDKAIVEEAVNGREVECSVLGNEQPEAAAVLGEIEPDREFYDYASKYDAGLAHRPARPRPRGCGDGGVAPRARRAHVSGDGLRGVCARRLLRARRRPAGRKRGEHDPRLHQHQHVSEALGGERAGLPRPPHAHPRARPRAARTEGGAMIVRRKKPAKPDGGTILRRRARATVGERQSRAIVKRNRGVEEQPQGRLPLRWVVGSAAAFVLVAAIVGAWWIWQSPIFRVQAVEVTGATAVSVESVLAQADLDGTSMVTGDFARARRAIEELPLVAAVEIEREWPDAVRIIVHEREPWGSWEQAGETYIIDREGVVLGAGAAPAGTPTIVSSEAFALRAGDRVDQQAVDTAAEIAGQLEQALGTRVVEVSYSPSEGVRVLTENGQTGLLGDSSGIAYKLAVWARLAQEAESRGIRYTAIDLRFGDRPVLR